MAVSTKGDVIFETKRALFLNSQKGLIAGFIEIFAVDEIVLLLLFFR